MQLGATQRIPFQRLPVRLNWYCSPGDADLDRAVVLDSVNRERLGDCTIRVEDKGLGADQS